MWLAEASSSNGNAAGVGVIYLIVFVALVWVIFGKHDGGKRDR